jgi:hypothetical protein
VATTKTAVSSTRSGANKRGPKRLSKLALLRVKIATIVAAIVLFFGSLIGIAIYNPGVAHAQAPVPVQAQQPQQQQQINIVQPGTSNSKNSAPVVVPAPPQVNNLRPFVRSRGS